MGKIVLAMTITAFILVFVVFLFLFLLRDMKSSQIYKNADQSMGKVKRQLEDGKINAYGSGLVGMRRRTYHQYEVEYQVRDKTYAGILWTKKRNLHTGDEVQVRYVRNKDTDEIEIVNGACTDRLRELAIGGVFGILLAAGIIILKMNGRI